MNLSQLLDQINENLNYGHISRDNWWNRGLWMFTNSLELVVHEKTLEVLQVNTEKGTYVKDDYFESYTKDYPDVKVSPLSNYEV